MPKVTHVKKARKEFKTTEDGVQIKKGDSYYWWKFRMGGYRTSSISPRPQQLTQSGYKISIMDINDTINNITPDDSLQSQIEDIVSELQNIMDEQQERLDSMPEQLQESSSSGEMLRERIDNLESAISELEGIDTEVEITEEDIDENDITHIRTDKKLTDNEKQEKIDELIEDKKQERYEEILNEIQNLSLDY